MIRRRRRRNVSEDGIYAAEGQKRLEGGTDEGHMIRRKSRRRKERRRKRGMQEWRG